MKKIKESVTSLNLCSLADAEAMKKELTTDEVKKIAVELTAEAKLGDIVVGFKPQAKKSKGRIEQLKSEAKEEGYPNSQVKPIGTKVYDSKNSLIENGRFNK